jgi:hypothetical protein
MATTEISSPRINPIEKIEISGNQVEIWGTRGAKSVRGFILGKIKTLNNRVSDRYKPAYSAADMEFALKSVLAVYEKYHPPLKETIDLKGTKGPGTFEVEEFPEYFLIREWRKVDWKDPNSGDIAKPIETKFYRRDFNNFLKAFFKLEIGKKYKTREVAEIWAKENHLWKNAHDKKIFGDEGFDYSRISGCRSTYMLFYYGIKILENKGLIHYEKHGNITRLEGEIKIQGEFI